MISFPIYSLLRPPSRMVKFRGINVSLISQHDVRKFPEYDPPISADPFWIDGPVPRIEKDSIASCYVPYYPGSQVCIDYSIDNPHPPSAQYFFKLLGNGKVFTSWDCTAKHQYQGRTTYALKYLCFHPQTGQQIVERQAFRFSTEPSGCPGPFDNCIEVRVYRIEHRIRLSLGEADIQGYHSYARHSTDHHSFRVVGGGVLGACEPKRLYKYQLLDAADKPHATIRFYYRSQEFLTSNGILTSPSSSAKRFSTTLSLSGNFSPSPCPAAPLAKSMRSAAGLSTRRSSSSCIPSPSEKCLLRRGSNPTGSHEAWLWYHRLQLLTRFPLESLVTFSDADFAQIGFVGQGARAELLREFARFKPQYIEQMTAAESEAANRWVQSFLELGSNDRVGSAASSAGNVDISESSWDGFGSHNTFRYPPAEDIESHVMLILSERPKTPAIETSPRTSLPSSPSPISTQQKQPSRRGSSILKVYFNEAGPGFEKQKHKLSSR